MFKGQAMKVLGTMSGTSLDGIDAAILETDGERILGFGETFFRPYSAAEQSLLHEALGRWEGQEIEAAEVLVETAHAEVITRFSDAELVGFHGQTVAHEPNDRGTLQLGNGAVLAEVVEKPVVWDFRSADIRLGGQGAPLTPFYHFALSKWLKLSEPVCFLNLGGVGNLTWVDPKYADPTESGALLAFDTGPANAPINDLMRARRGQAFDKDGALAAKGRVVEGALELFLDEGYFLKIPPKSLDRNDFSVMLDLVRELEDADAAATMTAMSAAAVMQAMQFCPSSPTQIFVAGGGRRNPVLMEMLAAGLDCPVAPVEAVGLDGDMLEAQAFAFLAMRVARGLPTSCPSTTGVRAAVGGGTLSRPQNEVGA